MSILWKEIISLKIIISILDDLLKGLFSFVLPVLSFLILRPLNYLLNIKFMLTSLTLIDLNAFLYFRRVINTLLILYPILSYPVIIVITTLIWSLKS